MDVIAFILLALAAIGYWLLTRAFYEMRNQLRAQTELLQTHTRLLATIANAADPVN